MTRRRGHEFSAEETAELLAELDVRLRRRGIAASIFIVGGAAIAATGVRSGRLTEDVDALTRDTVVLDEAKTLARERGLPETWLNPNANMWMPPLPGGVLDPPAEPGLQVTYAAEGFLLATKLIAQRARDSDDVIALAGRLGLATATPEQLEAHIRSYYTDQASLEFIVDGKDVDREITFLAQDASRMLNKTATVCIETPAPATNPATDPATGPGTDRLRRSRQQEQRNPPTLGGQPPDPHAPGR